MIRQSIAYNNANVKIIGHAAGQSMGYTGPSHHTLEDFSVLRAIPRLTILNPCDALETRQMVWWMAEHPGPVYLRLMRAAVPNPHALSYHFTPGRAELLHEGEDISIFVTGDMITLALDARSALAELDVRAQVVNIATLKPLPEQDILYYGGQTRAAITIEDHNILGGLGSAVAEVYAEHLGKPLRRMGIPDVFTESDDGAILRRAYGLNLDRALALADECLHYPSHERRGSET